MVGLQFNNLIFGSNFEPKIAGYSHGRLILPLITVKGSPLSVDDPLVNHLFWDNKKCLAEKRVSRKVCNRVGSNLQSFFRSEFVVLLIAWLVLVADAYFGDLASPSPFAREYA
jgi:hypothetical protein